jgi:hypothetical protein
MPIIRTPSPSYFAPVSHKYLDEDGRVQTLAFDAKFKRLKASEIRAVFSAPVADRPNDEKVSELYLQDARFGDDTATMVINPVERLKELDGLCEDYAGLRGAIALSWWQSITADKPAHFATKN